MNHDLTGYPRRRRGLSAVNRYFLATKPLRRAQRAQGIFSKDNKGRGSSPRIPRRQAPEGSATMSALVVSVGSRVPRDRNLVRSCVSLCQTRLGRPLLPRPRRETRRVQCYAFPHRTRGVLASWRWQAGRLLPRHAARRCGYGNCQLQLAVHPRLCHIIKILV